MLTQDEIYEYHRKIREAETKRNDAHDAKRAELTEAFEALGIFPTLQHPDYNQDTAYELDDIIEMLSDRAIACAKCGAAI